MDLYQNQSQVAQDYVKWSANEFLKPPLPHNVTSVINNFFYDWGHRYIYDMPTMGAAMATIGFHQLTECQIGQSQHDALKGLDNDTRMPPGFLVLESMVIEAQKPDAKA
ncbi:MAG TPA: hypothetical protein PKW15_08490, partial [Alphaproteobacteria bacterium]|nr:hypothetical protein [Alphaproteobacteria bacterium]